MVKLEPYWKTNPVDYLVRARHPLGCYPEPTFIHSEPLSPGRQEAKKAAEAYRKELLALDPGRLQELVEAQISAEVEKARLKAEAEEKERYFNLASAQADYCHWAAMSYWTVEEGVALSLGRDPRVVKLSGMKSLANASPFARQFVDKHEIATRAKAMGQLWEQSTPSTFLAWAERMRFAVPGELVDEVNALGVQICDWKTLFDQQKEVCAKAQETLEDVSAKYAEAVRQHSERLKAVEEGNAQLVEGYEDLLAKKDADLTAFSEQLREATERMAELEIARRTGSVRGLGAKERESLLKMVIGMAVGGYAYDPRPARSPITKEISDDLDRAGVPIDVDTVRKYLMEAKALLPGEDIE